MFLTDTRQFSNQRSETRRRHLSTGFTLIEVMITVAIVAILAAIALPSYQDYVRRSKLTEAYSALADLRVKMEQYYQDNRNYGGAGAACPVAVTNQVTGSMKYFGLACTVGATNQSYTATASNKAGQGLGAAGDYAFTINDANAKTTTKYNGVAKVGVNCWMQRKSDSC